MTTTVFVVDDEREMVDLIALGLKKRGFTIVPTRLYFKDGRVKVEVALARGKDVHDKRADIVRRDADRQIERALKSLR